MARRSQSASRAAQASAAKSATSGASTAAKRPTSSTISNAASAVAVARAAATGCNTRSTAAVGRRSDNSIATATGVSAVNGPSLAPETASSDSAPKRSSRLAGKKVPATAGVASTRLTVRQKPGKKAAPTKRTGRALTTEAGEHNAAGVRFTAFSVPVLKGKLQGLGLSTDGRKTALVARLVSGSASNDASTASSAADPKRDRGSYNPSRHSNIVDAHIHADMAVIKAASGPTLSGPRMFDPECHSKVVALLGNVDTSVLLNLPATFNGFKEAIAPVFGRADDIKVRFRGYVEEQRAVWSRQNPDKRPEGSATTFKLPNEAAEHFFRAIGATHGSRTKNYTCDKDDCTEQSCCPQEYNFSTVSTYAERLAADAEFTDHAGVFTSKAFKAYVRTGETRQQTCGRGSLPAAPILLPHAEAVVAEAKASIVQARADFEQASDTKGRAQAAYNAVRGASCKAVFVVDLCTGKRAADITSTLSADVIFTGTGNHRKIAAYNRTNKVLLPVRPWMVDARPNSILCPTKPSMNTWRSAASSGSQSASCATAATTPRCAAAASSTSSRRTSTAARASPTPGPAGAASRPTAGNMSPPPSVTPGSSKCSSGSGAQSRLTTPSTTPVRQRPWSRWRKAPLSTPSTPPTVGKLGPSRRAAVRGWHSSSQ